MIKVVAKNTVKKDKIDDFKKTVPYLISETRKEAGCISYELYQDINNENIFTFVEEWESNEALDSHMDSNHFKDVVPKLTEYQEKDMELNIYKLYM